MGEEIEQFLIGKLSNAVLQARSIDHQPVAKLLLKRKIFEQFEELNRLLENRTSSIRDAEKKDLREILYELIDMVTDLNTMAKKSTSYCPQALKKFILNLDKTLARTRGLIFALEKHYGNSAEAPIHSRDESEESTSRHIDATEVHGLDEKAKCLEKLLVAPADIDKDRHSFKAIGIVGMGGIGKTTFCQYIFNRPNVKQHFLPKIWVSMSKDKEEVVKRMLLCLGVEDVIIKAAAENGGLIGLLLALRLELTGKRYLIVLDDVRGKNKFYENLDSGLSLDHQNKQLAYALPKGSGGRVIVTCRDKEVAKNMVGNEELHVLLPLTDPESCWLIFKDWVQKDGTAFPPTMENLKHEIVQKCAGLPLAAKLMGQIMHQQLNCG